VKSKPRRRAVAATYSRHCSAQLRPAPCKSHSVQLSSGGLVRDFFLARIALSYGSTRVCRQHGKLNHSCSNALRQAASAWFAAMRLATVCL
jgi:hypothetical protein